MLKYRMQSVRQFLSAVLRTDSDFNAFCLDCFPEVHQQFGDNMDRNTKYSILFRTKTQDQVLQSIQQYNSDAYVNNQHILITESTPGEQFEIQKDKLINLIDDRDPTLDDQLGHYQLKKYLGRGGSGCVFKGWDPKRGRSVAIKLFYPLLGAEAQITQAMVTAARGLMSLDHASLIKIYDFGPLSFENSTSMYLVMDYIEDKPPAEFSFHNGSQPQYINWILRITYQIADALQAAHNCTYFDLMGFQRCGIMHGDIKPDNILFNSAGLPIILDFMMLDIQRMMSKQDFIGQDRPPTNWAGIQHPRGLTEDFGTPGFMAPEQAETGIVTAQSDIYSLGVTIFLWLFSRTRKGDLPAYAAPLTELLNQMISLTPADRPASMKEVAERIAEIARRANTSAPEPPPKAPATARQPETSFISRFLDRIRGRRKGE